MASDTGGVNRRSVLKTTGAALGLGLGATGTAAAVCTEIRLTADYNLLEGNSDSDVCVGDTTGIIEEEGTEFTVYDKCTDDNATYYKVACLPARWVSELRAECIRTDTRYPPCFEEA